MGTALDVSRRIATATAGLTLVIGIGACVAWLAGVPEVTRWVPASSVTVFNTGLLLMLTGGSTLAAARGHARIAAAGAMFAVLLATLTQAEYFWKIDLGIDELFVTDTLALADPGRPAPNTAAAFLLAGVSIILLVATKRFPAVAGAQQMLNALVIAICTITLIG